MSRCDRTLIAPLLIEHYPFMASAKSDEWHALLNAETGLAIPMDEPNPTAFDKWRAALEDQKGLPVWGVTQERIDEGKRMVADLLELETNRTANQEALLVRLRLDAPGVAVIR